MSLPNSRDVNAFRPGAQYWEDLSGYNERISEISEAGVSVNGLNRSRAFWSGESDDSRYVIWSGETFGHMLLASRLIVADVVEEIPDLNWQGDGNPPTIFSASAAIYTYSPELRRLGRRDFSTPDLFGMGVPMYSEIKEYLAHGQIINIDWGRVDLLKSDYSLVSRELSRGASGEFAIPFEPPVS